MLQKSHDPSYHKFQEKRCLCTKPKAHMTKCILIHKAQILQRLQARMEWQVCWNSLPCKYLIRFRAGIVSCKLFKSGQGWLSTQFKTYIRHNNCCRCVPSAFWVLVGRVIVGFGSNRYTGMSKDLVDTSMRGFVRPCLRNAQSRWASLPLWELDLVVYRRHFHGKYNVLPTFRVGNFWRLASRTTKMSHKISNMLDLSALKIRLMNSVFLRIRSNELGSPVASLDYRSCMLAGLWEVRRLARWSLSSRFESSRS